jgi:hypothetical protein
MSQPRGRFLRAAKWLWLLAVGIAVAVLAGRYWEQISLQIGSLAWWQLLISAAAVVLGKILLGVSARRATQTQGWRPPFQTLLAIVSLSQLGKYLPGGIWHFVGRGALYAAHGQKANVIAKALILENVWQWTSALLVGALLMYSCCGHPVLPPDRGWGLPIIAVVLVFAWLLLFRWSLKRCAPAAGATGPGKWSILGIQTAAWICFGISLWALFPAPLAADALVPATGAFALATLAGFLVPLAPAGLGVREVVLVALLSQQLDAGQAAICATMNRLVWLAVEGALAAALYRRAYPDA